MAELPRPRLWLNWEAFEVAVINPLFTADITLEKIQQLASKFPSLTDFVSFDQWKAAVSSVFRLNENQIQALYATLTCFLTKDPQEALLQSQFYLADTSACLPSFFTKGTDILCYLFAIFVKKKFRAVSEMSNLEAFPNRSEDKEKRFSTQNRDVSKSTPTVSRLVIKTNKEQSLYPLMVRFLINKLPQFLSIYAPDGLTRQHVESFSFLVNGGPTYAHKANSLAAVMGLFENTDVEQSHRFLHALKAHLPIAKNAEDIFNKYDQNIVPTSPLSYRPLFPRTIDVDKYENTTLDKPLLIEYETTHTQEPPKHRLEVPETPCDVHIYNCRHAKIYICSSVLTVFIAHCRDSTIFVGSAVAIHLEFCQNVKIIAASRMAHLDACQRCTAYFLVNTKPIVTGNCSRLVFAPYNALYTKFGLDTLCTGINPQLNLWDKPIFLASLGAALFEKISPANFRLFIVPMAWANVNPILNAPIPQEYLIALEQKRQMILSLKTDLDIIKEKDPELYKKLVYEIQSRAAKTIQNDENMLEIQWLSNNCPLE